MFDEENGPKKFNNPEHNEIPQPANAENSHESPEIDEIQAMKGEEVKELVEGAAELPRANEKNELIIDGKIYLTIGTLSKLETIDASKKKIKKIIRENNIQGVRGKLKDGNIHDFYPVEEVKKYTNINKDSPRANEKGELIINGEKYLTISSLGKLETIDTSTPTIKKIIKENNIQGVRGKLKGGNIHDFYPVEEVKKYTNINKELPRANENNELIIDGKKYLTIGALGKLETIDASDPTIAKIIRENNIQGVQGKSRTGIRDFYPVEEVKKHINVNKDLPRANEKGELIINGEKYLTIGTLGKLETIDASESTIAKIIKENNIQGVRGKLKGGNIHDFYPFEEVKKYTNVNKDSPRANKQNKAPTSTPKNTSKTINEAIGAITELPEIFQKKDKRSKNNTSRITKRRKRKNKKILNSINTATFIKGEAFEQLVGVFLAYQYPEEKIIPQYCLIVKPENGYYGLRADYKVGNDIYEIKWGRATKAIDECTEKQIEHIQEGINYKLISCVLNEDTKETFTPFIVEVENEVKNKDCIETFKYLTEKLKELADADDVETLRKYRDAFFSIYVNAMNTENKIEYIKKIIIDLATTPNLDEFIKINELTESPANLDANFEYDGTLYQGQVSISEHRKENKDRFEEEEIRKKEINSESHNRINIKNTKSDTEIIITYENEIDRLHKNVNRREIKIFRRKAA